MLSSVLAGLAGVLLAAAVRAVVGDQLHDAGRRRDLGRGARARSRASRRVRSAGCCSASSREVVDGRTCRRTASSRATCGPSLPFVVLFLVLIFSPALRNRRELTDPLAGVDPPPPPLASRRCAAAALDDADPHLRRRRAAAASATTLFFHADVELARPYAITPSILAMIFLSITVITGMAGEISLVPGDVRGASARSRPRSSRTRSACRCSSRCCIGAVHRGRGRRAARAPGAAARRHLPVARDARVRAVLRQRHREARLGRRRRGIRRCRRPARSIGSIDFDATSNKSFLVLCLVVLAIVELLVVIAVRGGTTGRFLDALRGSEVAAASIGINPTRARIVAFALSAGDRRPRRRPARDVREQSANYGTSTSSLSFGLFWVVLVVSLGRRTVEGAIQAAIGFAVFQIVVLNQVVPWLVNHVQPWYHMGVAAADARDHPVRPRRAHVRQAPRGHPRVPRSASRSTRSSADRLARQVEGTPRRHRRQRTAARHPGADGLRRSERRR